MISLNEEHNIEGVLENLKDWAQEVILVDSYSSDRTVEIALQAGIRVVQRKFIDFGDQWNFAVNKLDTKAKWTMKLDPDERISDELKNNLIKKMSNSSSFNGFSITRHLWFMGSRLPVKDSLIRVWKTGKCRFTDVAVNEHPIVEGLIDQVDGELEHHDSPDLYHWLNKQNNYTTAEARIIFKNKNLARKPNFFGDALSRRMWIKKHFYDVPFRYILLFSYLYLIRGAFKAGRVGYVWCKLRCDVMRLIEYKAFEMRKKNTSKVIKIKGEGKPDLRVRQY